MNIALGIIQATLLGGLVALAQVPTHVGGAAAPTDAQVRDLEKQLESLQQQLEQMNAAPDADGRQRLMQQSWQDMQKYVGQMHDRWVMGYPASMGYPWMTMGPGTMERRSSWPLPRGLTPEQYMQQMRQQTKLMEQEMDKIAQTADPRQRQRLMQEHWQSGYRHMQAMRGMGWMWNSGSTTQGMMRVGMTDPAPVPIANELPDADSADAKLVSTYCVQCHAAPQPTLHTVKEWGTLTQRMHIRMEGGWQGTRTPSDRQMQTIIAYMQRNTQQ